MDAFKSTKPCQIIVITDGTSNGLGKSSFMLSNLVFGIMKISKTFLSEDPCKIEFPFVHKLHFITLGTKSELSKTFYSSFAKQHHGSHYHMELPNDERLLKRMFDDLASQHCMTTQQNFVENRESDFFFSLYLSSRYTLQCKVGLRTFRRNHHPFSKSISFID
jgi:hypothetical protein